MKILFIFSSLLPSLEQLGVTVPQTLFTISITTSISPIASIAIAVIVIVIVIFFLHHFSELFLQSIFIRVIILVLLSLLFLHCWWPLPIFCFTWNALESLAWTRCLKNALGGSSLRIWTSLCHVLYWPLFRFALSNSPSSVIEIPLSLKGRDSQSLLWELWVKANWRPEELLVYVRSIITFIITHQLLYELYLVV